MMTSSEPDGAQAGPVRVAEGMAPESASLVPMFEVERRERFALAAAIADVGLWEYEAGICGFTIDETERRLLGLADTASGVLPEALVLAAIVEEDRERI